MGPKTPGQPSRPTLSKRCQLLRGSRGGPARDERRGKPAFAGPGSPPGTRPIRANSRTSARERHAAQRAALRHLATAANELLRSRQRLRALDAGRARLLDFTRASSDWLWELDARLRCTWIGGAFQSVTGFEAAQGGAYAPAWSELAVTLMLVALGFAAFGLAVRYLNVYPLEAAARA